MSASTALIIIDVQNDLINKDLFKADQLINNIEQLINKARSTNTPVIFIQHTEADDSPMGRGKEGWKIHPRVEPLMDERIILKYTPDSFHETNLHEELSLRGIKNLVMAGLQTEYCVDTTCRRAFSLGYNVVLIRDGHSTYDTNLLKAEVIIEHHNGVLGGWFVNLKKTEEIIF